MTPFQYGISLQWYPVSLEKNSTLGNYVTNGLFVLQPFGKPHGFRIIRTVQYVLAYTLIVKNK